MQYAVIVQSELKNGLVQELRQTALVPFAGTIRKFTRTGIGNRGSAGRWQEVPANYMPAGLLVGLPVSVEITEGDFSDLAEGNKIPNTLMQKLNRKSIKFTSKSNSNIQEVIEELESHFAKYETAFGVYLSATQGHVIASTPAVQVVSVPAPAPVAVASAPVASESLQQFTVPTMDDPEVAVYIPRSIYGESELNVYDIARARKRVVALDGHAGTGKTSSARYYSAVRGLPFLRLECHQSMDTSTTQGKFVPDGLGGLKWVYSPLAQLIQQPSVILLNEFTRTSSKNAGLFTGLLEERQLIIDSHQGEVIKVHPECLFIADYNSGYRGTVQLDQAILDRFGMKIKFTWSEEAERQRIKSPALLELARELRVGAELEGKFSTPISTRLLLNFVEQAEDLSLNFAIQSFLNAFPDTEQDAIKMLISVHMQGLLTDFNSELESIRNI